MPIPILSGIGWHKILLFAHNFHLLAVVGISSCAGFQSNSQKWLVKTGQITKCSMASDSCRVVRFFVPPYVPDTLRLCGPSLEIIQQSLFRVPTRFV